MARCKRNRRQRSARSFLPFALSERKLVGSLYPGRCPGLYSYWAFSPSLLSASTLVRCHGYTPVGLSIRICSQHQLLYGAMVIQLLGFQPVFARNIDGVRCPWAMRCCSFEENPKCESNTLFALSVCNIDLQPFHTTSLE